MGGWAVAASACVPGLFEPLVLKGLYPGRTVRLVDGGVHDNQGVAGLLNEGCNLVLCSDASGQMADVKRPSDGLLGVPLRTNSILMSRVREVEYQDLKGRVDSRSLQGLLFVHLKRGSTSSPSTGFAATTRRCLRPGTSRQCRTASTRTCSASSQRSAPTSIPSPRSKRTPSC